MGARGFVRLGLHAPRLVLVGILALLLMGAGPFFVPRVFGAQLTARSLQLSDNKPGVNNVIYRTGFTVATGGSIGSMRIQFCSNSALIEDPCTAPYGFDALNAQLDSESGVSGFIISGPDSTVNEIVLTQAPLGTVPAGPVSFTFSHIMNPADAGSYYVKVFTYTSSDGSGSPVDFGAMAFPINGGYDVSAEVPPYLLFCQGVTITGFNCSTAQGDLVSVGELSAATTSTGTSQILAATNASSGYAISVSGGTMTSGNNIIPAMTGQASQKGTSQFGINLRANNEPVVGQDVDGAGTATVRPNYNQPNIFRFTDGDTLASGSGVQDFRKYTISYIVNVASGQTPGVYSTTLTYICLATF